MNPTAELADIVLPVASAFERQALGSVSVSLSAIAGSCASGWSNSPKPFRHEIFDPHAAWVRGPLRR
jgi:hypothetical protein